MEEVKKELAETKNSLRIEKASKAILQPTKEPQMRAGDPSEGNGCALESGQRRHHNLSHAGGNGSSLQGVFAALNNFDQSERYERLLVNLRQRDAQVINSMVWESRTPRRTN